MIRIVLGNVGSGKTAQIVREIKNKKDIRPVFTNIDIRGIKNVFKITSDMLIKKDVVKHDKEGNPKYSMRFNKEFWVKTIEKYKAIDVVIDEAHQFFNPRRSMSKINVIMSDFLSMLRRILGSNDNVSGELVLITQLERRIDIIAKEMATNVSYSICHYYKHCKRCGVDIYENNEYPEQLSVCPVCDHPLKKTRHTIEVYKFKNIDSFIMWKSYSMKTYYSHIIINDIANFFKHYNTLQWGDMFSELYT